MNSVATYATIVATAIIAHIGVLLAVKHRRFGDESRDQDTERSEGRVSWASLATLAHTDDLNVRKNAIQLLVDYAISDKEMLMEIIRSARQSSNSTLRLQACTVLNMLARQPDSQRSLLAANALEAIVQVLRDNECDTTMMHATLVLCVLIEQDTDACRRAIDLGAGEALIRVLRDRKPLDDLLCGYTVNAIQSLACVEEHHARLINTGAIEALASTLEFLFGKSITVLKLCMQALDVLIQSLDDQTANLVLPSLVEHHVADIIWCNLRVENTEMLCWTVHFLSQLACRKVGREQLQRIPDLVGLLGTWINANGPLLARDVLRTLCVVSHDDDQLQNDIAQTNILTRLIDCVRLRDERDLAFSALVVLQIVGRKEETQNAIMRENAVQDFFALADNELLQNEQRIARHQETLHQPGLSPEDRAIILEEIAEMQNELVRSDPFITDLLCILSGGASYGRCVDRCRQLAQINGIWSHLGRYIMCNQTYTRFRTICTLKELSNVSPFITCQIFRSSCGPELMRIAHACTDHSTRHNAVITLLLQANQLMDDSAFSYDYQEFMTLLTTQTIKPIIRKIIMLIQTIYAFPIADERARPALPMIFGLDVVESSDMASASSSIRHVREMVQSVHATSNDEREDDEMDTDEIPRPITPANTPVNERDFDLVDPTGGDAPVESYKLLKIRETIIEFVSYTRLLVMFVIHPSFSSVVDTLALGPNEELPVDAASLSAWIEEMELLGAGGHRPFRVLLSLLLQMQWIPVIHAGYLSSEDKTFIRTKVSHTALTGNLSGVDQLSEYVKRVVSTSSSASSLPSSASSSVSSPLESSEDTSMKIDTDEGQIGWKDACFKYSAQLLACFTRYESAVNFINRRRFVDSLLDIGRIHSNLQPIIYPILGQLVWQMDALEIVDYPELVELAYRFINDSRESIASKAESIVITTTSNSGSKPISFSWSAYFYANLIMDHVACNASHNDNTTLSKLMTPNLQYVEEYTQLYNPYWTFESFRSPYGVVNEGYWAFEVVITIKGLVQVGWSTKHTDYQPESGSGVGDDNESYSIDGHRCMRWHGIVPPLPNDYGQRWSPGDVVTCMVDFTSQSITFALNGESLGVAFTSIDSNTMLYPSISCSAHQGCKIRYGYSWDPLEYAPPNYLPVVAAHPPPALMDVSPMSNTLQNEDIMNSGRSSLSINDLSVIFYYEINIQKRVFTDSDIIIGFRDVLGHYEGLVVTRSAFHYRRSHTSMLSKSHEIHSNPDTIMNSIEPVYSGDVIGCVVTMDQIGFYIQGTFWLYDHALTFKKVVPAFTTTNNIIDTELTSTTPVIYPFIHNLQCYHINYGQEPFLHYNNK